MKIRNTYTKLINICRDDHQDLEDWSKDSHAWLGLILVIVIGTGMYGFIMGLWRSPLQATFNLIKFPLLILLTTFLNAAINGMLAQLLGAGISFKESTFAILVSFAISSLILGSLAPISLFILSNTPPLIESTATFFAYEVFLLIHICFIAFAGTTGVLHLYTYLKFRTKQTRVAKQILLLWLAGNVFLGCQLSWNMRPFIGAPNLPVHFFRSNAFSGNFYETTWLVLRDLTQQKEQP